MPFHPEYLHQASMRLRPLFGPTRRADSGYYSRRIVHALRSKESKTRLARALSLWGRVYIGDWNRPEGYETWLKSLRCLIDAVDEDDTEKVRGVESAHAIQIQDDLNQTISRIEIKLDHVLKGEGEGGASIGFLSIKQAAHLTGLSSSHIRRAVKKGDVPASNVGTTQRPIYRIARKDLAEWMERKKDGTVNVPPNSELKNLIDLHLPGLRGRKDSTTR